MMKRFLYCLLAFAPAVSAQDRDVKVIEEADHLILNARYAEAVSLLEQADDESPALLIANKKAEALTRAGDYRGAEKIITDIQAQLTRNPDPHIVAVTATNLGFLQLHQGRQDLAEESLQEALRLLGQDERNSSPDVAQALSCLGLLYLSQGRYAQAQEQLHRVLSIRQGEHENQDAWVAAACNDLGLAYSQTDKDVALDYYKQAHQTYLALYGGEDQRIAISDINTGVIYRDLELFEDAIAKFENALRIYDKLHAGPHPAKAIALYNLGQTYLQRNDQKSAEEYYRRALAMYREYYGPTHPEVSSVLNAMGNLSVAQGEFDEALAHYQEALKANVPGFTHDDVTIDPALKEYYSGTMLLHSLLFKAQAFEARYSRKSLKFSDLTQALRVLSRCDSLIDLLRQHTTNESDKLLLGVMANDVYAEGVRIAYQTGLNAIRKSAYFRKAFYFAEKSKGAVLQESISDANARSFAGIPPALLEEERTLKSALALNARKLAQKPTESEERILREHAFTLKSRYDAFIRNLERDYPAYFDLKFNVETPSVDQLQNLLAAHTAVISYFIDEKNTQLYIFLVRDRQYRVWQKNLTPDFDRYITGLRNSSYFDEISTFKTCARELGRILIPPVSSEVTDLVVLPAGRLALVPFETLLTKDPGEDADYAALPYLLKQYSIRYEFSAGLLAKKSAKKLSGTPASIFLCAPVSFPQRPWLGELPGTETEVKAISTLFNQNNLEASIAMRENAGEDRFRDGALKDFQFIHFATHGVVDERHPELSRIFLFDKGSGDGDLFAGEIYNLELNARLVTLSACQTGLGKLLKGEGVIGLSRAFAYAGARSIVVSFWNVADQSTAVLMKDFYKIALNRESQGFGTALRDAKLRLMTDGKFAAPFHWAPFVLIGF